MNAKEICDILDITKENLKSIMRRQQLSMRLLEKGYRLISIEKTGRANEFNLEPVATETVELTIPTIDMDDFMKKYYPNVRKKGAAKLYLQERVINETPIVKDIAKTAAVTNKTIDAWDKHSEELGLLTFNGYVYFRLTPLGIKPIPYKEYAEYWGLTSPTKETEQTRETLNRLVTELKTIAEAEDPQKKDNALESYGVCVKVRSYLVNRFTKVFVDLERALK